ncbi:MAG: efflux RND transporter periplasmic adaptor subunit [Verrucomicrobia bacterium]|nr:efflux RND transporter periplasmic adaptor subunit [Verrucomicrobiota bacterium]
MNPSKLSQLQIDPAQKRRPKGSVKAIFIVVLIVIGIAAYYAWPRAGGERRVVGQKADSKPELPSTATASAKPESSTPAAAETKPDATAPSSPFLLTVSGYIINRERIEISPRFQGVVKWIGVKKGDAVKKDQVVVLLDDAEQKARVAETEGRLASTRVALARAELNYQRIHGLAENNVISKEADDEARLAVDAAKAVIAEVEGQLSLAKTYLDWTLIRSPIDGVVLEKLVEPGELVTPQSFGGTRGPSTAVLAVADLQDLQVEIDVNEADLAKITLGQQCKVSPEAYPEKHYEGVVAEISPEANRQKGTLQIKIQIKQPDRYLTPELSAKVEFLAQ